MGKFKVVAIGVVVAGAIAAFNLKNTTSEGAVGADRKQVMLVSSETVEANAVKAYKQVLADAKNKGVLNTDAATLKRVRNISSKLIAQTGNFREDALKWNWEVNVISEKTVNAWCMAGGKIVVYTGIIDTLKLTDAQLAAVIGHEISHALREHVREQTSRNQLVKNGIAIISSIAGFDSKERTIANVVGEYGLNLPFSRTQETEADNIGTELMARAGYDPKEAVKVWEKMSAAGSSSTPEFMSTHPSNQSRIKNLQVISEKVEPLYKKAK